jgi:hypothetical protein
MALNNQLVAYARETDPKNNLDNPMSQSLNSSTSTSPSVAGDVKAKATQWLKANQEELSVVAGKYVVPLALGLARGDNYAFVGGRQLYIGAGPEPQDPFEAWLFGPQTERAQTVNKYRKMGAATFRMGQDIQQVKRQKAVNTQQNKDLVERIKAPNRKQAAIDLHTNRFLGRKTSVQNLVGLIGNRAPKIVSDQTYEIEGALGRVYFDDLGNGSISIQSVRPELGRELQLWNGLGAIIR